MTNKIIRPTNTKNSLLVVHQIQITSLPHFDYKLRQQSRFLIDMTTGGDVLVSKTLNQHNLNNFESLFQNFQYFRPNICGNQVIVSGICQCKSTANYKDFTKLFMVVLTQVNNKMITSTKAKYARGLNQSLSQNIGGQNRYLTFKLERNDSFIQFDSIKTICNYFFQHISGKSCCIEQFVSLQNYIIWYLLCIFHDFS